MDAKRFRESADEIEAEGYLGWGSAMNDAADTIVALQSKNAAMRGAIEGALRIKSLWLPFEVLPQHEEEAKALLLMHSQFEAALSQQTGMVLVSLDDLLSIEIHEEQEHGMYICPACKAFAWSCTDNVIHEDDCWLAALLKKAE